MKNKGKQTQILHINYATKIALTKEAGRRQANGQFAGQYDYYPISNLFVEAIAKGLGLSIKAPEITEKHEADQTIPFSFNLPYELKEALRDASQKRKANNEKNWSQNAIAVELIEQFLQQVKGGETHSNQVL